MIWLFQLAAGMTRIKRHRSIDFSSGCWLRCHFPSVRLVQSEKKFNWTTKNQLLDILGLAVWSKLIKIIVFVLFFFSLQMIICLLLSCRHKSVYRQKCTLGFSLQNTLTSVSIYGGETNYQFVISWLRFLLRIVTSPKNHNCKVPTEH